VLHLDEDLGVFNPVAARGGVVDNLLL